MHNPYGDPMVNHPQQPYSRTPSNYPQQDSSRSSFGSQYGANTYIPQQQYNNNYSPMQPQSTPTASSTGFYAHPSAMGTFRRHVANNGQQSATTPNSFNPAATTPGGSPYGGIYGMNGQPSSGIGTPPGSGSTSASASSHLNSRYISDRKGGKSLPMWSSGSGGGSPFPFPSIFSSSSASASTEHGKSSKRRSCCSCCRCLFLVFLISFVLIFLTATVLYFTTTNIITAENAFKLSQTSQSYISNSAVKIKELISPSLLNPIPSSNEASVNNSEHHAAIQPPEHVPIEHHPEVMEQQEVPVASTIDDGHVIEQHHDESQHDQAVYQEQPHVGEHIVVHEEEQPVVQHEEIVAQHVEEQPVVEVVQQQEEVVHHPEVVEVFHEVPVEQHQPEVQIVEHIVEQPQVVESEQVVEEVHQHQEEVVHHEHIQEEPQPEVIQQ